MNAKQETVQEIPDDSDGKYSYRCGHCGRKYNNELLARVHITRSEDKDHSNILGDKPEAEIEVLDEDGNVVATPKKSEEDLNFQSLTIDDVPDDLKEQHKRIILAAAHNQYENNYSKLENKAEEKLERDGYDTPSYSTIRRVIRNFFRPQEEGKPQQEADEAEEDEEQTLSGLTTKQQAILIAKYKYPGASKKKWAQRADGAAKSYPNQVENDAEQVDDMLDQKIKGQGMSVEEVLLEELDAEEIEAINERITDEEFDPSEDDHEGFYFDLELEPAAEDDSEEFDLSVEEQQKAMSASPFEDEGTDAEAETATATGQSSATETWGDAETATATGSAATETTTSPDTTDQPSAKSTTETETAAAEPTSDDATREVAPDTEAVAEPAEAEADASEDMVPCSKVRADFKSLLDKVNFARRVTENGEDGKRDDRNAVLEEVEGEVEDLLQQY